LTNFSLEIIYTLKFVYEVLKNIKIIKFSNNLGWRNNESKIKVVDLNESNNFVVAEF